MRRFGWLFGLWGLLLLLSQAGVAQAQVLDKALPPTVAPSDTLVRILPCADTVARVRVSFILFAGNAVTRDRTLRAELDIHDGDTLTMKDLHDRLETNRRRLFNLQLFHTVLAQAACTNGQLTIIFAVQERWYTFPVPIFSLADRNLRAWLDRPDRWQRLDYGGHLTRNNFRGRNEFLNANLQFGFNRKYELLYEAPGLGRRRRVGFGMAVSYYQSHTLDYATLGDRLTAFRDEDGFPIQRFYSSAGLRFRHTVQFLSAVDISYHREEIGDSINYFNPTYFLGRTQREYLELSIISSHNQRNTFAYPLTGQFTQAAFTHRQFLDGVTPALTTFRLRYAHYYSLSHRFYYSFGVTGQTRLSRQVGYADNRGLGYDGLVRGYDEYVIDGRHYGLAQQGLSFRPFNASQVKLPGISNPKISTIPLVLYLNIFTDFGYVIAPNSPPQNRLPNHLLRSAGLGLHLVTYYDRVFTIEYTLNGLGETGYFFRSSFPI